MTWTWLLLGDNAREPLLAFLAVQLVFLPLQVALWPRRSRFLDGDPQRTIEHVACERCGKPVLVDALDYHRRRCIGRPKELRVASFVRRLW
jgi:hypothetical protein